MPSSAPSLHMLCGKIAAGKSTLAAQLSRTHGAVVISEDGWLAILFAGDMNTPRDFMRNSGKLRAAMGPHIVDLLRAGQSVVLDFQANTVDSRAWLLSLAQQAEVPHTLHFLDVPDEVCLQRLRARNESGAHEFNVTDDQFHQVTKYFVPPNPDEGLTIARHGAS